MFDHIPVGVGSKGVIPINVQDLEDCLEMGMDWSLREGIILNIYEFRLIVLQYFINSMLPYQYSSNILVELCQYAEYYCVKFVFFYKF